MNAHTSSLRWVAMRWALPCVVVVLSACSSRPVRIAPVETRNITPSAAPRVASIEEAQPLAPVPPGFYRVQNGDTLTRIAFANKRSNDDLIRWNNLSNPDVIEINQVIRIDPPPGEQVEAPVKVQPIQAAPKSAARSLNAAGQEQSQPVTTGQATAVDKSASTAQTPAASQQAPASAPSNTASAAIPGAPSLMWPAKGRVVATFDEDKSKGVAIAGKAGDPVVAAADGKVVYAGSGLRGYGNLLIIKHDETYLTAYAHNQELRVKQDQDVKAGQRIADMGSSDADQVKLHFEVRRMGKPIDPLLLLPVR